ncbi:MAG: DUF4326 domain-containing protein [Microthrixaceae bacterium]
MGARFRHHRRNRLDPLPPGVRLVDRSSRYGNPFVFDPAHVRWCRALGVTTTLVADRDHAVADYRRHLESNPDLHAFLAPLADAVGLACTCPLDVACHADVLLDVLERNYPRSPR